jgi:hypothetical protein
MGRPSRVNSMVSDSMKYTNTKNYEYPDQNIVNEGKRGRHNIWMEMIKNKRDRSLNRADRNIK